LAPRLGRVLSVMPQAARQFLQTPISQLVIACQAAHNHAGLDWTSNMIGHAGCAFALAIASCTVYGSALSQELMTLDFSWQGIPGCVGGSRSPAFFVRSAPQDTDRLLFTLSRADVEYGGEQTSYPARGNVKAGLIHTFGPCLPGDYRWNVVALDRLGRTLATADRIRPFQ
jgi:hypothetical protein